MSTPAHTNGHAVTNGHATDPEEKTTLKATHARHATNEATRTAGETTMKATHASHVIKEATETNETNAINETNGETMSTTSTSHVSHENDANKGETTMEATNETTPVTTSTKTTKSKARPALITAPVTRPEGPSEAEIEEALSQLDAISAVLGPLAVPLSIGQRRQELKMKPGGDRLVADVLGCAARYHLVIPGVSQDEATADLALATNLQPLMTRLQLVASLVYDVILQARGRAWQSTTTAYTMLLRLVVRFPALQQELQPMAALMATQHKDAPPSLRKKEAKQLARARSTKKAKKVAAAAQAVPTPAVEAPAAAVTPTGAPDTAAVTAKPASS